MTQHISSDFKFKQYFQNTRTFISIRISITCLIFEVQITAVLFGMLTLPYPGFILWYKFNSDYIFTRFGTCRTCCPVPLRQFLGV